MFLWLWIWAEDDETKKKRRGRRKGGRWKVEGGIVDCRHERGIKEQRRRRID